MADCINNCRHYTSVKKYHKCSYVLTDRGSAHNGYQSDVGVPRTFFWRSVLLVTFRGHLHRILDRLCGWRYSMPDGVLAVPAVLFRALIGRRTKSEIKSF